MSLLELMLTFFIIAILGVIAVPSYQLFFIQSESHVIQQQLFQAIYLTRNEAISRGEPITLCGSMNQHTCSENWDKGYIIQSVKKILYIFKNPSHQGILHWRAFAKNQMQLDYLPSGLLAAENGRFWYTQEDAKNALWSILISQSGRARLVE